MLSPFFLGLLMVPLYQHFFFFFELLLRVETRHGYSVFLGVVFLVFLLLPLNVHSDGGILGRFLRWPWGRCFLLPGRLAGICTVIEDFFILMAMNLLKSVFLQN
jgi:hypothetical protein